PADGLVVDVGHLDLDVAAVAVLLDGKVIVQQAQLILKGDQLLGALGNALGQPGEGRDHLGDAGGVLDGGHPADGVEGVVDEMGVDLGLQHLVFQVLLALLVLQTAGQQALHIAGQVVDPPADVPQLVGPFDGVVDGKVALADLVDAVAEGGHRPGDDGVQPAHQQAAHGPQQQDAQPDQQQVDHPLVEEGALGEQLDQLGVPALQRHLYSEEGAAVAGDAGDTGGGAGHARN